MAGNLEGIDLSFLDKPELPAWKGTFMLGERGIFNTSLARQEWTLADLRTQFAKPDVRSSKDGPYVIPAKVDGERKAENVRAYWGLFLDHDDGKYELQEALNNTPFAAIGHTTFSHSPECPRWRLFIPFSQPIAPAKLRTIAEYFNTLLGGMDKSNGDVARGFYLPAVPPGGEMFYEVADNMDDLQLCDPVQAMPRVSPSPSTIQPSPKIAEVTPDSDIWPEGGRNDALFKALCALRPTNYQHAVRVAHALNEAHCRPLMEPAEVETITRSACQTINKPVNEFVSFSKAIRANTLQGVKPAAREWVFDGFVPKGTVTGLYGPGGSGKSTFAQMLATHKALGLPLLGTEIDAGVTLYVTCEDDTDELHRRQISINNALGIDFSHLDKLYTHSRVGVDSLLVKVENQELVRTPLFYDLADQIKEMGAELVILDLIPDFTNINEIIRNQVNSFVKQHLGGIAQSANCGIVALAHPSRSGVTSGTGESGSTAWEGSFRSRLYLSGEENGIRTLTKKKANYSTTGEAFHLSWQHGYLVQVDAGQIDTSPRLGTVQGKILEILERAYEQARENVAANRRDPSEARIEHKAWSADCRAAGVKEKSFYAARDGLIARGIVIRERNFVYLADGDDA